MPETAKAIFTSLMRHDPSRVWQHIVLTGGLCEAQTLGATVTSPSQQLNSYKLQPGKLQKTKTVVHFSILSCKWWGLSARFPDS